MKIKYLKWLFGYGAYGNVRLTRLFIVAGLGLSTLWLAQYLWTVRDIKDSAFQLAKADAASNFKNDVAYRMWAASHGGVYVLVDEDTVPNPYLNVPYRDIVTRDGRTLTLFNPAYMTRKAHEMSNQDESSSRIHLTSLEPLNPINNPDEWELQALIKIKNGKKEISELVLINGTAYLRYLAPLLVEKGCIGCHIDQGYKIGDMIGGLSIAVPFSTYEKIVRRNALINFVGYFFTWVIMMSVLFSLHYFLGKAFMSRDMSEALAMDLNMQLACRLNELHEENIKLLQAETEKEKLIQELHDENIKLELAKNLQKKLENDLHQAQKMEAIGTLAGGIAHDFNNLLSVIIGYTELSKIETLPNSNMRENHEQVLVAAKKASALVRQILRFSRQHNDELIPMNLSSGLKEILKMIRSSFPSTIEIVQNISDKQELIFADPTQIHQVVMNLCANALYTMEAKGGILSVSLKKVTINNKNQLQKYPGAKIGEYVQLSVGDTGSGIDPIVKERIFEPYFTTKDVIRGTGLGLAIVHGIVTSYGGFINVDSKLGKGSSFNVFIPVYKGENHENVSVADSVKIGGNEKILFVDDEYQIVDFVTQGLTSMGYHVTSTTKSHEAFSIFADNPQGFDLVITDQTMPGLTGVALAQKIFAIRQDIPIIMCSGYSEIADEEIVKNSGVKEFLPKPVEFNKMLSTIRQILDKEKNTSQQ